MTLDKYFIGNGLTQGAEPEQAHFVRSLSQRIFSVGAGAVKNTAAPAPKEVQAKLNILISRRKFEISEPKPELPDRHIFSGAGAGIAGPFYS